MPSRFFSPDSFWNTPINPDHPTDPSSEHWIELLATEDEPNLWINLDRWTIPVYEVDQSTPRRVVTPLCREKWGGRSGHGTSFRQPVPIPDHAITDPFGDKHIAMIDSHARVVWDMFAAHKSESGEWDSFTGMTYPLDGPGVFRDGEFPVADGESIHLYGPGRAAGVPIIAGLIMHEEILAGRIEHKIAFASGCNAYQKYVFPATWTDGFTPGGLPEGCVIQLDPAIDLDTLNLSPAGRIIARALQEYGAVNVDVAGGFVIYAEGLYGQDNRTWSGLLDGDALRKVDINHYRVLETPPVQSGGRGHAPDTLGTWSTKRK